MWLLGRLFGICGTRANAETAAFPCRLGLLVLGSHLWGAIGRILWWASRNQYGHSGLYCICQSRTWYCFLQVHFYYCPQNGLFAGVGKQAGMSYQSPLYIGLIFSRALGWSPQTFRFAYPVNFLRSCEIEVFSLSVAECLYFAMFNGILILDNKVHLMVRSVRARSSLGLSTILPSQRIDNKGCNCNLQITEEQQSSKQHSLRHPTTLTGQRKQRSIHSHIETAVVRIVFRLSREPRCYICRIKLEDEQPLFKRMKDLKIQVTDLSRTSPVHLAATSSRNDCRFVRYHLLWTKLCLRTTWRVQLLITFSTKERSDDEGNFLLLSPLWIATNPAIFLGHCPYTWRLTVEIWKMGSSWIKWEFQNAQVYNNRSYRGVSIWLM